MIPLFAILGVALAQEPPSEPPREPPQPSNLAVTSLGAQAVYVPVLGQADVDLLIGQRLRWSLGSVDDGFNRLWMDSRFTLDPSGELLLERTRLTRLELELGRGDLTLDLGRSPVRYGGPRLVDGVQALLAVHEIRLGVWGGLQPDLFTTLPRLRPAFGPVIAWERATFQASLLGEVALSPDFALDRAASLAMVHYTSDRWLDLSGRADVDWVSADGVPHVADARALAIVRPTRRIRVDALYNAFSSYRYLQTELLDPSLQRFQQRLVDLGIELGVTQDALDPTVNHLVGAAFRYQDPTGLGAAWRWSVDARYRYHPNPLNRFSRIHGELGLSEIPAGGALDVAVDGAVLEVDGELQIDPGLTAVWEPTEARTWALDGSGRALLAPGVYDGMGWYTDLFFDAVITRAWLIAAGAQVTREPDPDFDDLGLGAFVRVSAHIR